MAVGVANPKAQGQAITNTATEVNKACEKALSPPTDIQTMKVTMEIPNTIGTNIPAISYYNQKDKIEIFYDKNKLVILGYLQNNRIFTCQTWKRTCICKNKTEKSNIR